MSEPIPAPTTKDEADALRARLAELDRQIASFSAMLDAKIRELVAKEGPRAQSLLARKQKIEQLLAALPEDLRGEVQALAPIVAVSPEALVAFHNPYSRLQSN